VDRRAISCQHYDGENATENRVPVEAGHMATYIEVRENAIEKSLCVNRNSTRDLAAARRKKGLRVQELEQTEMKSQSAPVQGRSLMWPTTSSEIPRQMRPPQNSKEGRVVTAKA